MGARRLMTMAMAVALSAASCGASQDSSSVTTDTVAATDGGASPTAGTEATTSSTDPERGSVLSSLLMTEPGKRGWLLPPGRWTSDAFQPPLTFETTSELILRSESKDSVVLLDPMNDGAEAVLTLVRVGSVPSPTGQQPPSRTRDELYQAIVDHPAAELLTEESLDDGGGGLSTTRFEIEVNNNEPKGAKPCWLGIECLVLATSFAGEDVFALNDQRAFIYLTDISDGSLRAYLTGAGDELDEVAAMTDAIVGSLEVGGTPADPSGVQSLGAFGSRLSGLPAGDFRTLLGDVVVGLAAGDGIPDIALTFSGQEMLIFQAEDEAFLVLFTPSRLISDRADQERLFRGEELADDLLDGRGLSSDEFEAWLESMLDVVDVGTIDVGDTTVPFWSAEVDPGIAARNCDEADSPAEWCVKLGFSDGTFHWQSSEELDGADSGGWFFLPEPGVAGYGAGGSGDEAFPARFQPILDRLSFSPAP